MADSKQPADLNRPDLEESTNVAEAHATLLESGAAQAREKRIAETGMEPVSLWVMLACAVVLLVGGGVLGAGGKFNYNPHPQAYIRPDYPTGAASGPTIGPIFEALMKRGKSIFSTKCSGCHGAGGAGDGAARPPLAGSEWVTGNTERMAMIILNGLEGNITVAGKGYGTDKMDSQAPIGAADLAAVMTFVRNSFGNSTGDVLSLEQAEAALQVSSARAGKRMTVEEITANHDKMLEGEPRDPTIVVDFETLKPVEAAAPAGAEGKVVEPLKSK